MILPSLIEAKQRFMGDVRSLVKYRVPTEVRNTFMNVPLYYRADFLSFQDYLFHVLGGGVQGEVARSSFTHEMSPVMVEFAGPYDIGPQVLGFGTLHEMAHVAATLTTHTMDHGPLWKDWCARFGICSNPTANYHAPDLYTDPEVLRQIMALEYPQ